MAEGLPPDVVEKVKALIEKRQRERAERTTIQLRRETLKRLFQLKADLRLRSYDEVISYLLDLYEKSKLQGAKA